MREVFMSDWLQKRDEICDYVDGLLSPEKRKDLDNLINQEPEAREFYEEIKKIRSSLSSLKSIKATDDFDTVLRTRIRLENSISRRGFMASFNFPVAIATVTAALLAIFLFSEFSDGAATKADFADSQNQFEEPASNNSSQATRSYPTRRVNSNTLRQRGDNRIDSLRSLPQDRPLITVEF